MRGRGLIVALAILSLCGAMSDASANETQVRIGNLDAFLMTPPDVEHPLVRVHPHTGREGMYVKLDDCIGIEGMAPEAGFALIKKMFDYTVENFAYTHKWKVRDLLIWDNRGALHAATPYDKERYQRLVYRTTVQGEKPIAPTLR